MNFPFCAFGLAVAPLTVKLKSQEGLSLKQKVLAVDWLGGGFFTAGTASFLIGITWAGVQFPWKSYQSLLPIVLGLLAVAGTLVYEKYRATRPFLRLSVFSSLSATLVFFITMGHGWMVSLPKETPIQMIITDDENFSFLPTSTTPRCTTNLLREWIIYSLVFS